MTPQEKAEQILLKMHKTETIQGVCYMTIHEAKQCALIAVDEILEAIDWHEFEYPNEHFEYWHEVKDEINKL
jgi:hypothetical protein